MRHLIIVITLIILAGAAYAIRLEIVIPPGPGLTRLAEICDDLRDAWNKPGMTSNECGEIFLKMGARTFNKVNKRRISAITKINADHAEDAAFDVDLPLPSPLPTAVPTPTPTATPTPTPRSS